MFIMIHIGIIVYMITLFICFQTNLLAIIKLFSVVYNLEYTDFQINISKLFQELMNDKYLADVTLVTEDDIQVRAHKIILNSSSIL